MLTGNQAQGKEPGESCPQSRAQGAGGGEPWSEIWRAAPGWTGPESQTPGQTSPSPVLRQPKARPMPGKAQGSIPAPIPGKAPMSPPRGQGWVGSHGGSQDSREGAAGSPWDGLELGRLPPCPRWGQRPFLPHWAQSPGVTTPAGGDPPPSHSPLLEGIGTLAGEPAPRTRTGPGPVLGSVGPSAAWGQPCAPAPGDFNGGRVLSPADASFFSFFFYLTVPETQPGLSGRY